MNRSLLLACLSSLALCACGTTTDHKPLNAALNDDGPGEEQLRADVAALVAARGGPANSQYEHSFTDLNGDGRRDALVLFTLPYGYWCGWAGCTMAVFTADDDSFNAVSDVRNVRGPVMVAENTTNGWRDIVVRVSGTHMADKNVALQFEHGKYPENPAGLTDMAMLMSDIPGKRVFP